MKERLVQWIEGYIHLPSAGLDVSEHSIKYAQFLPRPRDAGGGLVLSCIGEEEVPEGAIVNGVVEKIDVLTAVLKKIGAKAGHAFRASGMVVSLPEEKSFVRVFQTPKVGLREMAGAIRWKIEEEIPLPSEDVIYDFEPIHPIQGEIDHHDAVVTAFPRGIVAAYVRAIEDAGFLPVALELESQAIVRAVAPSIKASETVMVIDMGRDRTSIILFAGGAIVFTTTVPVGGRTFDMEIASARGISEKEAVEMKKKSGLTKDAYDEKTFAAITRTADTIAEELRRVIGYYQEHITHVHGGSSTVQSMLLSGGGANMSGLDTYLASVIRIPVMLANPFAGLHGTLGLAVPPMLREQAISFTAAIGLALRGTSET